MTDANQALLFGLVGTVLTGVVIPVVTYFLNAKKLSLVKEDVVATKQDVAEVHRATNSMQEQLVVASGLAGEARGFRQGEQAQRNREAERAKGALEQRNRASEDEGKPPTESRQR